MYRLGQGSAIFFALRTGLGLVLLCGAALNKITGGLSRSLKNMITQSSRKCFQNWKRTSKKVFFCIFEENWMKFLFFGIFERKNAFIIEKKIYIFALA